jgi:hypothetical protein
MKGVLTFGIFLVIPSYLCKFFTLIDLIFLSISYLMYYYILYYERDYEIFYTSSTLDFCCHMCLLFHYV